MNPALYFSPKAQTFRALSTAVCVIAVSRGKLVPVQARPFQCSAAAAVNLRRAAVQAVSQPASRQQAAQD